MSLMRDELSTRNVALILGHPAHVLRVLRFIELTRPVIYILTDGSGSQGGSRVEHVLRLISDRGARPAGVFCRFADRELYRIIREGDTQTLKALVDEIVSDVTRQDIDFIAGDGVEGFNPVHDLCRYLTNAVATIHERRSGRPVKNYDFLLDGSPDGIIDDASGDDALHLELSDPEFGRKIGCIREYPGIETDVERAMRLWGESAFRSETLRPVESIQAYTAWDTDVPYYESYGAKMIEKGVYSELITYDRHLRPLAEYLTELATSQASVA